MGSAVPLPQKLVVRLVVAAAKKDDEANPYKYDSMLHRIIDEIGLRLSHISIKQGNKVQIPNSIDNAMIYTIIYGLFSSTLFDTIQETIVYDCWKPNRCIIKHHSNRHSFC
jgi:hypothetical protein